MPISYIFACVELRTHIAAPADVKDWVRISEMFLGKVPDDFSFVPKHKSATYKEENGGGGGGGNDGGAEVEG